MQYIVEPARDTGEAGGRYKTAQEKLPPAADAGHCPLVVPPEGADLLEHHSPALDSGHDGPDPVRSLPKPLSRVVELQKAFGDVDCREAPGMREAVAAHDRESPEVLQDVQTRNAVVSEVCAVANVEGCEACERAQTAEAGVSEVVAEGEVQGLQRGDRRELRQAEIRDADAATEGQGSGNHTWQRQGHALSLSG